ncbi:MAG: hypothetical protein KDA69_06845, partial [Planctomycetaceae bacterium]|nr:hypothetical protein [Planctomycetaceae bacterium]
MKSELLRTLLGKAFPTLFKRRPRQRIGKLRFRSESLEDRTLLLSGTEPVNITVSIVGDESNGDLSLGDISLREAIEMANASPDNLIIGFASSLSGQTIELDGQLDITSDMGIIGLGVDNITIDGKGQARLFTIAAGVSVTMRDVTFSNGFRPLDSTPIEDLTNSGGAFLNLGTLTLIESRLTNNQALRGGSIYSSGELFLESVHIAGNKASYGGGVYAVGPRTLTVADTEFEENRANGSGGAIFVHGPARLQRSLFVGNSAGIEGGGVWTASSATLNVANSTFVENATDQGAGGAIVSNGTVTVTNSTITANWSGRTDPGTGTGVGGGISINPEGGGLTLNNTVVAGNSSGPLRVANDLSYRTASAGGRVSGSHNLIGDSATSADLLDGVSGNIVGNAGIGTRNITTIFFDANEDGEISEVDLLDFSGPHRTIAPEIDSPLIDAGNNALALDYLMAPLLVDHRGQPRVRDGNLDTVDVVDIGAYEDPAPIVVNSHLDIVDSEDALTTLREAVIATSADVSQDHRIRFAPSLIGMTIQLAGEFLSLPTGPVFISGPGEDALTIDANNLNRVFQIRSAAIGTIDGLTITGGASFTPETGPQDGGGGIWNEGVLNLTRSRITGNQAATFRAGGGGIRNTFGATATILSSIFDNNSATNQHGGGFSNSGTATIVDSIFEQNQANVSGGAIFNYNGVDAPAELTIARSHFLTNTAGQFGGVILASGTLAPVTIRESRLENNVAVGNAGGAIWAERSPLTVVNSVFTGNRSVGASGGAIRADVTSVYISGSTFVNNEAKHFGGAVSIHNSISGNEPATIMSSYFEDNQGTNSGGAVFIANAAALIAESEFINNTGFNGGAVRVQGIQNPASIVASTFLENHGLNLGGAVSSSGTILTIAESVFLSNRSDVFGGALSVEVSPMSVINSTFVGNAANLHGGAIRSSVNGTAGTITNSTIVSNRGRMDNNGAGGGLRVTNGSLTLNNTIVAGNTVDTPTTPGQFQPNEFSLALGGTVTGYNNIIGDVATAGGFINNVMSNMVGEDGQGTIDLRHIFIDTNNDSLIDVTDVIDNGGNTFTLALTLHSVAQNAGRNDLAVDAGLSPLLFDQRGDGFDRFRQSTVDIGAYESELLPNSADLLIFDAATGRWRMGTSTGSSFIWTLGPKWNPALEWQTFTGDFNGDGLTDGIGVSRQNGVFLARNNGNGTMTT